MFELYCHFFIKLDHSTSLSLSIFIGVFELCRRYILTRIYYRDELLNPVYKFEHTIELTDKSLVKSSYYGVTEVYWKSIEKIYKYQKNIHFVYARRYYISVPLSSFTNVSSAEEFLNKALELWNMSKKINGKNCNGTSYEEAVSLVQLDRIILSTFIDEEYTIFHVENHIRNVLQVEISREK